MQCGITFVNITTIAFLVSLFVPPGYGDTNIQGLKIPQGCVAGPNAVAEPYTKTGYANIVVHVKSGVELVFIPSGEFSMGDKYFLPKHQVVISKPFYMSKTEVTNVQYRKFHATGYDGRKDVDPAYELYLLHFSGKSLMSNEDNYPVVWVSWTNAVKFCAWSDGLELPSEAEWEYACRAGSDTAYYFGDIKEDCVKYGWLVYNSKSMTHEVAQLKPNSWGLYDMIGNALEWTFDDYVQSYNGAPADGSARISSALLKVLRGGSWDYGTNEWLSTTCSRFYFAPANALNDIGFRVVLRVK